jgi:hypothetical protein
MTSFCQCSLKSAKFILSEIYQPIGYVIEVKMKTIKLFSVIAILVLAGILSMACIRKTNAANSERPDKGFAVVELFTSEGCSSCPPADRLVAQVQKESSDKPVYILAFHVDYWNRLGWTDAFSSADYTARQKQYAQWLKLPQYYTPQAIVNGQTELVGSEEAKLRSAITTGLQSTAKTEVTLSDVKISNNKTSLQYHTSGTIDHSSLLIALIERNATTKVDYGENGGKTLSHVQIVRNLETVSLKKHDSGQASIALPNGFSPEGWELIAFVQNTSTGEITGAAKVGFPLSTSK